MEHFVKILFYFKCFNCVLKHNFVLNEKKKNSRLVIK